MSSPDLSVVIPVYNRGALVRHTLASVRAASEGLAVETIVVDDGSAVPLADDLARLGITVDRLIRQENRGLLFARLAGLEAAAGRCVLFLDSDDLVSADKLHAHAAAHAAGADVAYTDTARESLPESGPSGRPSPDAPLPAVADPAAFFITVQPAPHSPSFRTAWLRECVAAAPFPPSPLYNPVAEIWFYHVCASFPARVEKCLGLAIIGEHPGARLTNHWERLAAASLAVQEAFARSCPATPGGERARLFAPAKPFGAWRRLPRGFSPEYSRRLLDLWRRAPRRPAPDALGGPVFRLAAALLGPLAAGRLFRLRNGPYAACRTLDDETFSHMLAALPPP